MSVAMEAVLVSLHSSFSPQIESVKYGEILFQQLIFKWIYLSQIKLI